MIPCIDALLDDELVVLLEELAGSERVRRLGWRIREASLPRPERFAERNRLIRKWRELGLTYGQIRQRTGLSKSRLWKIVEKNRSPFAEANASTAL